MQDWVVRLWALQTKATLTLIVAKHTDWDNARLGHISIDHTNIGHVNRDNVGLDNSQVNSYY